MRIRFGINKYHNFIILKIYIKIFLSHQEINMYSCKFLLNYSYNYENLTFSFIKTISQNLSLFI